jgi:hypothetical protein
MLPYIRDKLNIFLRYLLFKLNACVFTELPTSDLLINKIFVYIEAFLLENKVITLAKYNKIVRHFNTTKLQNTIRHRLLLLAQLLIVVVQQKNRIETLSLEYEKKCEAYEKLTRKKTDVVVKTTVTFERKYEIYFSKYGVPEGCIFNVDRMKQIEQFIKESPKLTDGEIINLVK